ncbi:calcineurin-like phosphoesterase family protein [Haloactinopolyspora alba]|uniref:Calcineurin-like phosphoesterase family protein n=1 Tax=Haloactinopolyspora alba TaxID=648780 RepID=A0A2P8EF51_9ACTN|nr:metallophosphoesterase family protein [Haloactinopolyspora alba]PSL08093.1 calcineurin-like phosphoesterase family protein [Haloactinopolyspora alba]
MSETEHPAVSRRRILQTSAIGAASAAGTFATSGSASAAPDEGVVRNALRFNRDGRFTIVQFNDTQDNHTTDRRTIELQEAVLDDVTPDFALINGDVINGDMSSAREVKQAINNVVMPMERRGVSWALTMGNHDEDSAGRTGMTEADILSFIRRYRHNVNKPGADVTGTGNQVLTVRSARGNSDSFALWLLDSGRYAPDEIAGQDFTGYPTWDWLRFDQVDWYWRTSQELEHRRRTPVPGLVFQHIALWEHRFMWFASVDARSDADHERAVATHGIVGERNEDECPGPFNSGMFNAMLHRGDIKGLFVGHDHINTYVGNYYGIELGYGPGTGFGTYGLGGTDDHRLRGARVFTLDENVDGVYTGSKALFASDYGIDLTNERRPSDPQPLPRYVR